MSAAGRSETVTRALTGTVFVGVVMGAVVWSPWSNALLWAMVAVLAWSEWFTAPEGPGTRWPKALLFLFPVPALADNCKIHSPFACFFWLSFYLPF